MTNNIIKIASSVATALEDFGAEVSFAPEYDLRELNDNRVCVVVPVNTEYERVSRSQTKLKYRIEVGLFYRAKTIDMSVRLTEADVIIDRFLQNRINGAICLKAEHVPLYDAENLRTRNQFTSVVALNFEEVQ